MTEHPDDLLHIASCRTCRDRFTADNVANFGGSRADEPERTREFLETARRLERERAGVQEVVSRLLRATPASEWPKLADAPELHNSAAVEQLIEEVRKIGERTPLQALTLSDVAITIAESLPKSSYPAVVLAQLQATTWKERASSLRCLGRHEDALSAAETAEQRLSGFAAVGFDRAIIQLVKAWIVNRLGRVDEALELLDACSAVFADYGDAKMLLYAGVTRAGLHYEAGRYAQARQLWTELRDVAQKARDTESIARIENNLGYCATHEGDFRRANIHFSNGIALFNDIGARTEATRSERGAGRLLVAKGQINAGLAYLRSARRAFVDAGMSEEAILCGLEIVEVLLQRGDTAEGCDLAHQIVEEVSATGLGEKAGKALESLYGVLSDGRGDAITEVRSVHALLTSLQEAASA